MSETFLVHNWLINDMHEYDAEALVGVQAISGSGTSEMTDKKVKSCDISLKLQCLTNTAHATYILNICTDQKWK